MNRTNTGSVYAGGTPITTLHSQPSSAWAVNYALRPPMQMCSSAFLYFLLSQLLVSVNAANAAASADSVRQLQAAPLLTALRNSSASHHVAAGLNDWRAWANPFLMGCSPFGLSPQNPRTPICPKDVFHVGVLEANYHQFPEAAHLFWPSKSRLLLHTATVDAALMNAI